MQPRSSDIGHLFLGQSGTRVHRYEDCELEEATRRHEEQTATAVLDFSWNFLRKRQVREFWVIWIRSCGEAARFLDI
jgi:hypothetical protein